MAKNASTSFYGNIVALAESPVKEGLLYVGTDDGLIQVTEDGGANWRKIDKFPGVPDDTYVSRPRRLAARRRHRLRRVRQPQERRLQALPAEEHRPRQDAGRRSPATCPSAASVWTVAEDHVKPRPALRRHRVRPLLHAATAARTGPSSRAACRRSPSATSRSRSARTTSWSRPSAAASTSSTTTRRCGRRRPRRSSRRPRSSRCASPRSYIRGLAARRPRQGVPGRRLLHRAQPAVRRRLHLLPEGRDQDAARRQRQEQEKEPDQGGRHARLPDLGGAARRGPGGGSGHPPDRDGCSRATSCAA